MTLPPRAVALMFAAFALQPVAFGAWLPRIPDVRTALDLSSGGLALCLLGLPVGTLMTLPVAGRLVARIGVRAALIWGYVMFLAVLPLVPLAPHPVALFAGLFAAGVAMPILELALNLNADRMERSTGRLIMNTCHGAWSLGIMSGTLIGSALAAAGIGPALAVGLVALAVLPFALITVTALPLPPAPPPVPSTPAAGGGRPGWDLIAIGLFIFGITTTEGAVADWSAIHLRDEFGAGSGAAGLGYAIFAGFLTLGRFTGDRLKAAIGAQALARFCGGAAIAGMVLVVAAPGYALACAGFAITGFGVSVGFPLAVSAAASLPGRKPENAVAALTFMALTGFLVGPVLIGALADLGGLRLGLAVLLPLLVLSWFMVPALGGRSTRVSNVIN